MGHDATRTLAESPYTRREQIGWSLRVSLATLRRLWRELEAGGAW